MQEATRPSIENDRPVIIPDNMIFVKGGTFQMGDQFGDGDADERPVHTVTLSDFYLSRTELTFAEYDRFCEATGRDLASDEGWGRGNRPVINLNWYDAVAYCNWLSDQHGMSQVYTINNLAVIPEWSANGYRLPTEAEWEYSARNRGKKQRFGNDQGVISPERANFNSSPIYKETYSESGRYREQTVEVNTFLPNSLGLESMTGNVSEWCWDMYDSFKRNSSTNPSGPNIDSGRVIRGGSWLSPPASCSVTSRTGYHPGISISYLGFRLARNSR